MVQKKKKYTSFFNIDARYHQTLVISSENIYSTKHRTNYMQRFVGERCATYRYGVRCRLKAAVVRLCSVESRHTSESIGHYYQSHCYNIIMTVQFENNNLEVHSINPKPYTTDKTSIGYELIAIVVCLHFIKFQFRQFIRQSSFFVNTHSYYFPCSFIAYCSTL